MEESPRGRTRSTGLRLSRLRDHRYRRRPLDKGVDDTGAHPAGPESENDDDDDGTRDDEDRLSRGRNGRHGFVECDGRRRSRSES